MTTLISNDQTVYRTSQTGGTSSGRGNRTFGETIRFGFVGSLNTAIDFAVFLFLTHVWHWNVLEAQTASYTFGLINSYFWNRTVTFRGKGKPRPGEVIRFISVNLASYLASLLVLSVMTHFGRSDVVSKLVATLVTFAINFAGSKWWVFRDRSPARVTHRN